MTSSNNEIIIIGGGHNGLVCAAYLAKAGRKVTVLEASGQVGGAAATREFAPGYRASAFARDGIIEAIEPVDLDGHPFILGVQWHPETLVRESENHPFSLPILLSFMEEVHEVSSK